MLAYIDGKEIVLLSKEEYQIEGLNFDLIAIVPDFQEVQIGDTYDNGVFISKKTNIQSHILTRLQFSQRFTLQELATLEMSNDPIIKVLQKQQDLAEYINILDQNTINGVMYLVQSQIITMDRANEILRIN